MFSDNIFSLCLLFGILYLIDGSRLSGGVACLVLESRHTHKLGGKEGKGAERCWARHCHNV